MCVYSDFFFLWCGGVGKELSALADALCCYCSIAFGALLLSVPVHSWCPYLDPFLRCCLGWASANPLSLSAVQRSNTYVDWWIGPSSLLDTSILQLLHGSCTEFKNGLGWSMTTRTQTCAREWTMWCVLSRLCPLWVDCRGFNGHIFSQKPTGFNATLKCYKSLHEDAVGAIRPSLAEPPHAARLLWGASQPDRAKFPKAKPDKEFPKVEAGQVGLRASSSALECTYMYRDNRGKQSDRARETKGAREKDKKGVRVRERKRVHAWQVEIPWEIDNKRFSERQWERRERERDRTREREREREREVSERASKNTHIYMCV